MDIFSARVDGELKIKITVWCNFNQQHTIGLATALIRSASMELTRSLNISIRGFRQTISTLIGLNISRGSVRPWYQQIRFPWGVP